MKVSVHEGFVESVDHDNGDLSVVNAARVSFRKETQQLSTKDARLIGYLHKHNHWTPFGHGRHTFQVKPTEGELWADWLANRDLGWKVRRETGDYSRWIVSGSLWNWLEGTPPPVWGLPRIYAYLSQAAPITFGATTPPVDLRTFPRQWSPVTMFVPRGYASLSDFDYRTVRIKLPVFVARQWMRSNGDIVYNEVSRRYVDDDPEFHFPSQWRARPEDGIKQGSGGDWGQHDLVPMQDWRHVETAAHPSDHYEILVDHARNFYRSHVEAGVAPEQARIGLPVSHYTELWMTANMDAFNRVIRLRVDSHAQKEIRDWAAALKEVLHERK